MGNKNSGRLPYAVTEKDRATAEIAVGLGMPHEEVAKLIGISRNTLYKHFRAEIDIGATKANYTVGKMLLWLSTQSKDERVRLDGCRYWTARRMGWKPAGVTAELPGGVTLTFTETDEKL